MLPFLRISWWLPGWLGSVGLLSFLPNRCDGGKLFILAPQWIFAPFFDHDTSGTTLSPHSDNHASPCGGSPGARPLAPPFHHSCSFIKVWFPALLKTALTGLLERIKWQATSPSAGIGTHLELRLAVVQGSIVGCHQTL